MKLIEVINLNTFIEEVRSKSLPFTTSYKIVKLAKAIEIETIFYQEKFREIIMKYAELDEHG
jgi:hypothetical protein